MKVNILGTEYKVIKRKYRKEPRFKRRGIDGYVNNISREIVYCDISTHPGYSKETRKHPKRAEKIILRHEIIHAFLFESGLDSSALECEGAWSENEEMVDWFALQGVKIYKAFQKCNCI